MTAGVAMRSERPSEMTDDRVDLSIVIPAYNEASRIARSLERVRDFLDARGGSWEIVVVDDGSSDATAATVQSIVDSDAKRRIQLVHFAENRGKGGALRAGMAATRGRRVLMMDADLATPIEELDRLVAALDTG